MGWVVCGFFNFFDDVDLMLIFCFDCFDLVIEICLFLCVGLWIIVDI